MSLVQLTIYTGKTEFDADVSVDAPALADDGTDELADLIRILIIAVCILIAVILIIAIGCCYCMWKYRRNRDHTHTAKAIEMGGRNLKRKSVPSTTNISMYDAENPGPPSPIHMPSHGAYSMESIPMDGQHTTGPELMRVQTEGTINNDIMAVQPDFNIQTPGVTT